MPDPSAESGDTQLRIFLSYSRRNAAVADALFDALTGRGFKVTIDRRDLEFGVKWQAELAELIRLSDTVIWLISEPSINSEWVNWELDQVARCSKRLVPVMLDHTPRDSLPRQLGEIHILPLAGVFDLARDLDALVGVLEKDHDWLREASRLADRAHEWLGKDRTAALLLRGGALSAAEDWKERKPQKAPAPAPSVLDLILVSRQMATRRQWWWLWGSLAVAAVSAGLSVWAEINRREAGAQRNLAVENASLARRNEDKAVISEKRALEQRNQALIGQSRFLANMARQELDQGDSWSGALLALEGLVDGASEEAMTRDRPYVTEPEYVLYSSLDGPRDGVLLHYAEPLTQGALHPSGNSLLTIGIGRSAELRDLKSGKTIQRFKAGDDGRARVDEWGKMWKGALSPDGRLFLGLFGDDTARVWNAQTGAIVHVLRGHRNTVLSGAFSPDGKVIATGSADATLRLWDSATGEHKSTLQTGPVLSVAFSPDGTRLAAGSRGHAQIWELSTGSSIAVLKGHDVDYLYDAINDVRFSADSQRLVTAGQDTTVRIWRASDGGQLQVLRGHTGAVVSAELHPRLGYALTASSDRTARLWDLETGREAAQFNGHQDNVTSARFIAGGGRVLTTSTDGTARIWELSGARKLARMDGSDAGIRADGSRLTTLGRGDCGSQEQGFLEVREAATGQRIRHACIDGGQSSTSLSADGRISASFDEGRTSIRIGGADLASEHDLIPEGDKWSSLSGFQLSADGSVLFAVRARRGVGAWDVATGRRLSVFSELRQEVVKATPGPDGRLVMVVSKREVGIWDWREAKLLLTTTDVASAMFGDARSLVTQALDGSVSVWDIPTGNLLQRAEPQYGLMTSASVDRGKGRLVAGYGYGAVVVSDLITGRTLAAIEGHRRAVVAARLSSDGARVLTASEDGKAMIWDVASGNRVALLEQLGGGVLLTDARWLSGDTRAITLGLHQEIVLSRTFPKTQDLVDYVKSIVPRCLGREQRRAAFLEPAPPGWCIELGKWPYHTAEWKTWLADKRSGKVAKLPGGSK